MLFSILPKMENRNEKIVVGKKVTENKTKAITMKEKEERRETWYKCTTELVSLTHITCFYFIK